MTFLAHGVGRVYDLPIPLYLYLIAAGATVAASFAVRLFARAQRPPQAPRRVAGPGVARAASAGMRFVGLAGLGLAIIGAIQEPGGGFTLATLVFWVGLIVGTTALSAIVGGAWAAADPWTTMEGLWRDEGVERPARVPPAWLTPAVVYLLFWFELVPRSGFEGRGVLLALAAYTLYTVTIRGIFGARFVEADPLWVLFGLAANVAPFELNEEGIYRRSVVAGIDRPEAMPVPLWAGIFVLMASTTFDNARETVGWSDFMKSVGLTDAPTLIVDSVFLALLAVPFFVLFVGAVAAGGSGGGAGEGLLRRARLYGWSLVPIAVAYVLAHNASLLVAGVPRLVAEVAALIGVDGLFGSYLASPAFIWYLEIALIVGGHILGVLVAHRVSARSAGSPKDAVRSQYALTALMSVFTIATLWLLALPLVR